MGLDQSSLLVKEFAIKNLKEKYVEKKKNLEFNDSFLNKAGIKVLYNDDKNSKILTFYTKI